MGKVLTRQETERVREALEGHGQRFTYQRAAVYSCLQKLKNHPTAEEVYIQVKKEVPTISLATVYKALDVLVNSGLAMKLSFGDHSARYDARTDKHSHTRCLRCGAIRDLPTMAFPIPGEENRTVVEDFVVTEYRLEALGYCLQCHKE